MGTLQAELKSLFWGEFLFFYFILLFFFFPSSLVFLVQFWWIVFDFLLVGCRYGVCFISFFFFQFSIAMLFILVHVLLFFFFFFFHNCVLPIQIVYVLLSEDLVFFILFYFIYVFSSCASHVFVKNPSNKNYHSSLGSSRVKRIVNSKEEMKFMITSR